MNYYFWKLVNCWLIEHGPFLLTLTNHMIGKEENKSEEVEYVRSSSELPKLPAFMADLSATLEGDVSTEAVQKSSQVNMGIRKQRPWFSISQEAKAEARFCPDGPRPSLRSSKKTVLMRPLDFSCVDGRAIPDFDRLIRGLGKISSWPLPILNGVSDCLWLWKYLWGLDRLWSHRGVDGDYSSQPDHGGHPHISDRWAQVERVAG